MSELLLEDDINPLKYSHSWWYEAAEEEVGIITKNIKNIEYSKNGGKTWNKLDIDLLRKPLNTK